MYPALVFLGMHIPLIAAPAFQWRSENAMSYSKYKPVHYGIMGVSSTRKLYKVQLRLDLCHGCDQELYDCYKFVRFGCYSVRERCQIRRKYACEGSFPDPSLLSNW